jgi:hypothetical protein
MMTIKSWMWMLALGVGVLAGGARVAYNFGALAERERTVTALAQLDSVVTTTVATLRDSLQVARAQVRVDSIRIPQLVTRWRTVVDSVASDTVYARDTVRVLIAAGNALADECLAAQSRCSDALNIAERATNAEHAAHAITRQRLAASTMAQSRAESRAWRHRVEGALGVVALTVGGYYVARSAP